MVAPFMCLTRTCLKKARHRILVDYRRDDEDMRLPDFFKCIFFVTIHFLYSFR